MRFFALQTDKRKIVERFCHKGECVVLLTYYHGLSFFFAIVREIIITSVLAGITIAGFFLEWPMVIVLTIVGVIWFVFVFFNVFKAYIDWCYDFILVTTDKIILVDQTSIFKQEIKPIHLENIGSVSTETQFMGIFPFGMICFRLKEGEGGEEICKKYVPRSEEVASKISAVVTNFQRGDFTIPKQYGQPQAQRPAAPMHPGNVDEAPPPVQP